MKVVSIVFQNANYKIKYKQEQRSRDFRPIKNGVPSKLVLQTSTEYWVYFDDPKLIEQFGNPFEFETQSYPQFEILIYKDGVTHKMAEAVIQAITNKIE